MSYLKKLFENKEPLHLAIRKASELRAEYPEISQISGLYMAASILDGFKYSAFCEVLWQDYQDGKIVLTDDQITRITELCNKKIEHFKKSGRN